MPGIEITLQEIGALLLTLLLDPMSNLSAALLLYAVIGTIIAIVLVFLTILILSISDKEEIEPVGGGMDSAPDTVSSGQDSDLGAPARSARSPVSFRARLASAGMTVLVFGGVWVVAGYTTSVSPVCSSCHIESVHTLSSATRDPHEGIECVACHEPGGIFGRVTTALPMRSLHIFDAMTGGYYGAGYGRVKQSACRACHSDEVASDNFNEIRGIRMSHDEPLEAGATCLDCHTPYDGVIAGHNAGMEPCLRCHNQVIASSDCSLCHEGDPAASASVPATFQPAALIEDLRCGGCHNEARDCDPCHNGFRLPHSNEFMLYAHARQATIDLYTAGGRVCQPCHTDTRRPCTRCHTQMLGRAHPPSLLSDHQEADASACDTCHQQWAYTPGRDFCLDVCHTEAAYRYSPR